MVRRKAFFAAIIVVVVTILCVITKESLLSLLYATIIGLFPTEIKNFFLYYIFQPKVRVTCSYLFRIELSGQYFLVKDEHNGNMYQPVGGVYKYNHEGIDLFNKFGAEYDNLHDVSDDVECDLRLTLPAKEQKNFFNWFASNLSRENIEDISREFVEELIRTGIVDSKAFDHLDYVYSGSIIEKSYNEVLKMRQYQRYDIVHLLMDKPQKACLNKLMEKHSDKYVFVISTDIVKRHFHGGGRNYKIADHTILIADNSKRVAMDGMQLGKKYCVKVPSIHEV